MAPSRPFGKVMHVDLSALTLRGMELCSRERGLERIRRFLFSLVLQAHEDPHANLREGVSYRAK